MSNITLTLPMYDKQCKNFHDRFISQRNAYQDITICKGVNSKMEIEDDEDRENQNENTIYQNILANNLLEKQKMKSITDPQNYQNKKFNIKKKQKINKRILEANPFKVLDATSLQDDFYINVLDWSQNNNLAVALVNSIYVWNFNTNKIDLVEQKQQDQMVTSLTWEEQRDRLVYGQQDGIIKIYDFNKMAKIRSYRDNNTRVGTLSYSNNLILSGNKNGGIHIYDVRIKRRIKMYNTHSQEVCGLKWSPNNEFFASGGNDNKLYVYSSKIDVPLMKKTKKAAIKALDWSPYCRGVLASGGGTVDKRLSLWNVQNSELLEEIDTGSQICCLRYSKRENEIITTHGFSKNEINIWSGKKLQKIGTLKGHAQRVLYLSLSPNSNYIVTGAGDETLRFWDLKYPKVQNSINKLVFETPTILRQLIHFILIFSKMNQAKCFDLLYNKKYQINFDEISTFKKQKLIKQIKLQRDRSLQFIELIKQLNQKNEELQNKFDCQKSLNDYYNQRVQELEQIDTQKSFCLKITKVIQNSIENILFDIDKKINLEKFKQILKNFLNENYYKENVQNNLINLETTLNEISLKFSQFFKNQNLSKKYIQENVIILSNSRWEKFNELYNTFKRQSNSYEKQNKILKEQIKKLEKTKIEQMYQKQKYILNLNQTENKTNQLQKKLSQENEKLKSVLTQEQNYNKFLQETIQNFSKELNEKEITMINTTNESNDQNRLNSTNTFSFYFDEDEDILLPQDFLKKDTLK